MLASLQGLDGDFHMPGIGGNNAHYIDVGPLQYLRIIAVGVGFPLANFIARPRALSPPGINITDGQNVTKLCVLLGIA